MNTSEIIKHLESATDGTTAKIIKDYIDSHDTSQMIQGERYYYNENDIINRKQYYFVNGVKTEDPTKPNNRIPHGYHKLLVDQKTSYLVGNPVVFSTNDDAFDKAINETLGDDWDDAANELVKGAANKGVEFLHPYIDEGGAFGYIVIPAEQGIPIYDSSKQKTLEYFIRYYPITLNGEERIKAEWWTKSDVTYYVSDRDGSFELDQTEEVNPAGHFYYGDKGYGWGKVPFIAFKNNEKEVSDLTFYKQLIDNYDRTVSDVANNIEEIQSLIWILKGYEGTNLSEFMSNLKYYKAVNVDSDGGVDTAQAEIPIASIDSHLNRLEESIFTFGQGVNTKTDKFGQSPSGIALKFLYSLLDLKANQTERKFRKSLKQLVWFVCEYLNMAKKTKYDYNQISFTFGRSMLVNELEQAQIANVSKGVISNETIINNHPWVDDASIEMKRIEQEQALYQDLDSVKDDE